MVVTAQGKREKLYVSLLKHEGGNSITCQYFAKVEPPVATLLSKTTAWLVSVFKGRPTEIQKDAIPAIRPPYTRHTHHLEVLLDSSLLYKSWVWS